MHSHLEKYGLNDRLKREATLYEGLYIGRISEQHRDLYKVIGEQGEQNASVSGKMAYLAENQTSFPAVGDWVMIDRADGDSGNAIIHKILQRRGLFTRKAAGTSNELQVIAANIDVVFICMSLNADFNLRRIERYLTIAWESGAEPVVVLTKSDLCDDLPCKMEEISSVTMGAGTVACSSKDERGCGVLEAYMRPGETIALIGSSGVGKSTLINRLIGQELLAARSIREGDDRGRHTTTHRQLLLLPNGSIVIDTPGMRELQIYTGNLMKTFEDIEEIAAQCKYKDCSHRAEPGCMVKKAIEDGMLSAKRFESYQKLCREISYDGLSSRQTENEKINRMFGGKGEMKRMLKQAKDRKSR